MSISIGIIVYALLTLGTHSQEGCGTCLVCLSMWLSVVFGIIDANFCLHFHGISSKLELLSDLSLCQTSIYRHFPLLMH